MENLDAGGSVRIRGKAVESTSSSSSGFYGVAKTLFSVLGIRFVLTESWATGPVAHRAVVSTSLAPAATHGPLGIYCHTIGDVSVRQTSTSRFTAL